MIRHPSSVSETGEWGGSITDCDSVVKRNRSQILTNPRPMPDGANVMVMMRHAVFGHRCTAAGGGLLPRRRSASRKYGRRFDGNRLHRIRDGWQRAERSVLPV